MEVQCIVDRQHRVIMCMLYVITIPNVIMLQSFGTISSKYDVVRLLKIVNYEHVLIRDGYNL
jgi:hypothetical protein